VTASLVALLASAVAVVSFTASGLSWAALAVSSRWLRRLSAAAEARLVLSAILAPPVISLVVVTAALAPLFGWIVDHCVAPGDAHTHPHLCAHHVASPPALLLTFLSILMALQCVTMLARLGHAGISLIRARRRLEHISTVRNPLRVLPLDSPQAFLVGLLRPTLYVTRGLLLPDHRADLGSVLAHERAHIRRRDPLRRFVAAIALPFHLPFVSEALERRLAQANEMAADEEAATRLGNAHRVATALVRLARASLAEPVSPPAGFVHSFGASDIEARVVRLLAPRARSDAPRARAIFVAVIAALGLVCIGAEGVHHGLEMYLGLLSH
jgi:Zn-dependent protease with chaperone function